MNDIQRLLTDCINTINAQENRDNRPRFSISFIRNHPGLFITMYIGWFATLAVMLHSPMLQDSVWLLFLIFILLNGFFFFDINPRYRYSDIDVLDLRVCYNGEWYNTRVVPDSLIEDIMASERVPEQQKTQLRKMLATKGELTFYDIYSLCDQRSPADNISTPAAMTNH